MEMCLGVNLDMISDLPANVTDQILVRLPITDAVRTSVLSTKWRYKWTTIPELVFHDHNLGLPSPHNNNSKDNFIDRVLLLHSGFIHKFKLSNMSCLPISSAMIDVWIFFLSRKNIKELVLKFPAVLGNEPYKLPTCIFSAQQICTLELESCVLKPPPTFTGFSNLKSLDLRKITFVDKGGFECLISKCPLLERLTLDMIGVGGSGGIDHLIICSPNLKYLCLRGSFEDIYFENTPLLSDLSIDLTENVSDEKKLIKEFLQSETGNVVKVLSSLPSVGKFSVGFHFLKFLAMGKIPEKLPFTCHHLNILSLHLNFEDVNKICVTLCCLLNSSPNLQQLEIDSIPNGKSGNDIENFWEERTLIDWNMSGLQIVKITDIYRFELDLDLELEFIKLLLAHSPMLEMLSIICCNLDMQDRNEFQFLKELVVFPRASPKAKIKFLDELEE